MADQAKDNAAADNIASQRRQRKPQYVVHYRQVAPEHQVQKWVGKFEQQDKWKLSLF